MALDVQRHGSMNASEIETAKEKTWTVDIYEKAEHWSFAVKVIAPDAATAREQARLDYGKGYVIKGVYRG